MLRETIFRRLRKAGTALLIVLCALMLISCGENTTELPVVSLPCSIDELPAGCTYEIGSDGLIRFLRNGKTVGGIEQYAIPEGVYDPDDPYFYWLNNIGIPDCNDSSLCCMGGSSLNGFDWMMEFASDVPPGTPTTVRRNHSLLVDGSKVYDVWFDMLQLNDQQLDDLLRAIQFDLSDFL